MLGTLEQSLLLRDLDLDSCAVRDLPLAGGPVVPEEVSFPSGDLTLRGYLYRPAGEGPFPCIVTNHGSTIHQEIGRAHV